MPGSMAGTHLDEQDGARPACPTSPTHEWLAGMAVEGGPRRHVSSDRTSAGLCCMVHGPWCFATCSRSGAASASSVASLALGAAVTGHVPVTRCRWARWPMMPHAAIRPTAGQWARATTIRAWCSSVVAMPSSGTIELPRSLAVMLGGLGPEQQQVGWKERCCLVEVCIAGMNHGRIPSVRRWHRSSGR